MKIVLNKTFGGFGLSSQAIEEIAKRKGKKIYLFTNRFKEPYLPTTHEAIESEPFGSFVCFTVPNPNDYNLNIKGEDGTYKEANKTYESISFEISRENRTDQDLVAVVEQLGKKANGKFAELYVVEIPDNIEFEIDDYDGWETLRESHRSW